MRALIALALLAGCRADPADFKPEEEGLTGADTAASPDDTVEGCNDMPLADEICDQVDNDCDGQIDEGLTTTFYADADGDGHGDPATPVTACEAPVGYVPGGADCDDARADVHPDAAEPDCADPTDYNCDGSTGYADADGDGFAACLDCDDASAAAHPAAQEVCDDADNDCDSVVDEDAGDAPTWYADADADGWGTDATVAACDPPEGYAAAPGDCDDADARFHPSAEESDCTDPNDYNCDGGTGYADADGDGFAACAECDDTDASANPAAAETCDGADDDCDGDVDEDATDAPAWYADADGDGFGSTAALSACEAPEGYVADATDCDDASAATFPGAVETCNDRDDDCDAATDEAGAAGEQTWYADADGDGYGDPAAASLACDAPPGSLADASDCDDALSSVNPDATESCNSRDDDCDGAVDESGATGEGAWYRDADGDGYGDAALTALGCAAPAGYVADASDCEDASATIHPDAADVCDAADNDCSGAADDGGLCPCDVVDYDGSPYMFCETAAAWSTAEATCAYYGYALVSLADAAENTFVVDEAYARYAGKWWTGLNDAASEGTWAWTSGEGVTYTNWHAGEPNDSGGDEDCMQLGRYLDDTWNDEPCGSSFRYVCEG